MAARSTGTLRSATVVVTTGTAPPPSPRPRPPRPPPPPLPAAEPEQPEAATTRTRPETSMHARFDKVMNSTKREMRLDGIRAARAVHLRRQLGRFLLNCR